MAQSVDPRSSFVYLIDHLPSWQASIRAVLHHSLEKKAEFLAEDAGETHQTRPKRRRTASASTVRISDEPAGHQTPPPSAREGGLAVGNGTEVRPLEVGNTHWDAQTRRKRKPEGSIRSGASGPQKFRGRSQAVVYYDGHLQHELDEVVKMMGVGRNHLRKGKTALAVAQGFRLPPLSTRAGQGFALFDDIKSSMVSRSEPSLLSGKKSNGLSTPPTLDHDAAFLQLDKELEDVQSLCETAAHQFLRDGDCRIELETICRNLDTILAHATTTAESLKQFQADRANAEEELLSSKPNDDKNVAGFPKTPSEPSVTIISSPKATAAAPAGLDLLLNIRYQPGFLSTPGIVSDTSSLVLASDNIEVDDDSDQESIVLDISHYRLTNPRRAKA